MTRDPGPVALAADRADSNRRRGVRRVSLLDIVPIRAVLNRSLLDLGRHAGEKRSKSQVRNASGLHGVAPCGVGRCRAMRTVGYARVSTRNQNADLQVSALEAIGASRIYTETASGKTMDRPQLRAALQDVEPGDVLAVWRLDRLGRSVPDLVAQVNALAERGVEFRSLVEAFDTTTAGGRLVFHVFGAIAEYERGLIIERTRAGLDAARSSGRVIGRPRLVTAERAAYAAQLRAGGMKLQAIARELRVSKATVIRLLDLAASEA